MNCPNCKKEASSTLNDGGSSACGYCKIVFHKCVGGRIKYDSPGPSLCPICKYTFVRIARFRQIHTQLQKMAVQYANTAK